MIPLTVAAVPPEVAVAAPAEVVAQAQDEEW